jgi:LEA14-like dessication related protein
MASRSFFRRHPILSVFLGLLLAVGIGVFIFFQTTSKEELVAKGKTMVMPDLKSAKFVVDDITEDSLKGKVTIRINNSLPMTIDIDSLQYKITMEGDTVTKGYSREGIRINANANDEITVPIRTNIKLFRKKVLSLQEDSAEVGIHAVLFNHFPIVGTKDIPLHFRRTVYIPRLPKIEVEDVDISKLNFKGGKLIVKLKVTNYSDMAFVVNGFTYRFQMSDNINMKGTSNQTINLNKKGEESIMVPMDLKMDQLGEAVWEMVFKSDDTPYTMSGNLHIQTESALGKFDYGFQSSGTLKELKEAAKAVAKDVKDQNNK